MKKLGIPLHGLSLRYLTAEAGNVDWRKASGIGVEGYTVLLPKPTYGNVAEYDPDLFEADESDDAPDRRHCQPLTDDDLRTFQNAGGYDDWAQGFEPIMNYAWPVSLAYGMTDLDAVIANVAEFAPNCTLVELSDEAKRAAGFGDDSDSPDYAIALNGGGMDLSDNIVAAYLCCGCVPPITLLERQAGVMSRSKFDRLPLPEAFARAADWLDARKERLADTLRHLAEAKD